MQQTGSVRDFQVQFETLLSKTNGIPRNQLLSYFTSGLKEDIKADVQFKEPRTLHEEVDYAMKVERTPEKKNKKKAIMFDRRSTARYWPSKESRREIPTITTRSNSLPSEKGAATRLVGGNKVPSIKKLTLCSIVMTSMR